MMIFPHPPAGLGIPVGAVTAFAGPLDGAAGQGADGAAVLEASGWMLCDGRSLDCSQYPELFAVLGYLHGGADGSFNIPDYRGSLLRGEPAPAEGQAGARALPAYANYIIRFTWGAGQSQPLQRLSPAPVGMAHCDQAPSEPVAPSPAPQQAAAGPGDAAVVHVDAAGTLSDGLEVMDGQVIRLVWPATEQFAFDFNLFHGPDGRFKALRCSIHGRSMRFEEDAYLLPLSLKTQDRDGRKVEIRMQLVAGQSPYEHGVWCRIDVPDFQFEGMAFVFSGDVSGIPPLTIW